MVEGKIPTRKSSQEKSQHGNMPAQKKSPH